MTSSKPRTPRERARVQTMQDITRIGREHLATHGAAALSLRAVARDLGVVSSAVYRYVASRDELLTLLVVDAYTELADTVDSVIADSEPGAPEFRAYGHAIRNWGLAHPARYALIFGSPVPNYAAPEEITTGPGTRVIIALMRILARAHGDDDSGLKGERTSSVPTLTAALRKDAARARKDLDVDVPLEVFADALIVWPSLFGAISFDVFDQYGHGTFTDRSEVFEYQLDRLVDLAGLAT